jgi:hypothetical protein
MLTAAALDIAVTVSLNGAARGRLWLHAAPEGGRRLMQWYENQGLEHVDGDATLPGPRLGGRQNDGRYFQLTPATAAAFSDRLQAYRR